MIGFDDLFTSYNASGRKHARGVYILSSYYHSPKNGNFWYQPSIVKIGMSMNLYSRMSNYELYYPEGFWSLGFIFLPLEADENEVKRLESDIHSGLKHLTYKREWFSIPNLKQLVK